MGPVLFWLSHWHTHDTGDAHRGQCLRTGGRAGRVDVLDRGPGGFKATWARHGGAIRRGTVFVCCGVNTAAEGQAERCGVRHEQRGSGDSPPSQLTTPLLVHTLFLHPVSRPTSSFQPGSNRSGGGGSCLFGAGSASILPALGPCLIPGTQI